MNIRFYNGEDGMNKKYSLGDRVFDIFNVIFMVLFAIICIYPFLYILNLSWSANASVAQYGLNLWPKGGITFDNYKLVFSSDAIMSGFANTILRTGIGTFLMLIFTILGAYPLSKKYFPNRRLWTSFIVITMFFNGGLIPNFFLVRGIGLYNTFWSLVLPGLINTFYMIIMRNFMMTIPDSLEESAKIDGANDVRILVNIILPVCKPIIATVALWSAVWHWNSYFDSLIYISDQKKQVLQVVLYRIINAGSNADLVAATTQDLPFPEILKASTIIITILPIVMVYPFLQKYFMKGMLIGSVKG